MLFYMNKKNHAKAEKKALKEFAECCGFEDGEYTAIEQAQRVPKGAEQNKCIAEYWEAKGSQEALKWVLGEPV